MLRSLFASVIILLAAPACAGSRLVNGFHSGGFHGGGFRVFHHRRHNHHFFFGVTFAVIIVAGVSTARFTITATATATEMPIAMAMAIPKAMPMATVGVREMLSAAATAP
jgi:hypothetical protein